MNEDVAGLSCVKAYDVRGRVPDELNEPMAVLFGKAFAKLIEPRRVAVGHDMRPTGRALTDALIEGLTEAGVDVVDLGEVGTEQVYFAVFHLGLDGGIMVTASHNPAEYNGMKFVREKAIPISSDSGLGDLEIMVARALAGQPSPIDTLQAARPGSVERVDVMDDYVEHLLGYVDPEALERLTVVANGGDGMAGPVIERLRGRLPLSFRLLYGEPDGSFPHGVPNPLLPENRAETARHVREAGADLGLAWDGDFDRCFFFDERGDFVDGYYLVGLLAKKVLERHPGSRIVHDPRLVWNTLEIVEEYAGVAVESKSGHSFIKEVMREHDAIYGGEMSAHHYFRGFSYADSGMIPWLLVVELMTETGRPLSELVGEMQVRFPISGEINRTLSDPEGAIRAVEERYAPEAISVDTTDGVSVEYERWRFNVRPSNTEPLVRLNVETRGDPALLEQKTEELLGFLDSLG